MSATLVIDTARRRETAVRRAPWSAPKTYLELSNTLKKNGKGGAILPQRPRRGQPINDN